MGVGAADDFQVEHVGQHYVVNVGPLAAQEARVFLSLDRMAHAADFGGRSRRRHFSPPSRSFAAAYWYALTMLTYPVHRHRLPEMACRISSSVGLELLLRKAYPAISMPGVQ